MVEAQPPLILAAFVLVAACAHDPPETRLPPPVDLTQTPDACAPEVPVADAGLAMDAAIEAPPRDELSMAAAEACATDEAPLTCEAMRDAVRVQDASRDGRWDVCVDAAKAIARNWLKKPPKAPYARAAHGAMRRGVTCAEEARRCNDALELSKAYALAANPTTTVQVEAIANELRALLGRCRIF